MSVNDTAVLKEPLIIRLRPGLLPEVLEADLKPVLATRVSFHGDPVTVFVSFVCDCGWEVCKSFTYRPAFQEESVELRKLDASFDNACSQMAADAAFWVWRMGRCRDDERRTGISSDALACLAYGGPWPAGENFPRDSADLAACYRTYTALPNHRHTVRVDKMIHAYEVFVETKCGAGTINVAATAAHPPLGET